MLVSVVLNRDDRAVGLSLACAVIPFQLVMMTVVNGLDAVQTRGSIIANMSFPRKLIPISGALTELFGFLAMLSIFVLMMGIYAVAPTTALAFLPVVVATNFAVACAAAYPASLLGLSFREFRPFAVSLVRTMFFVAPGLVALDQMTGKAHDLVRLNPISGVIEGYRDVLLYGNAPELWELAIPLGWAALIAVVFVPVYGREQRDFAKVLT